VTLVDVIDVPRPIHINKQTLVEIPIQPPWNKHSLLYLSCIFFDQPVYLNLLECESCNVDIVGSILGLANCNYLSVFRMRLKIEVQCMSALTLPHAKEHWEAFLHYPTKSEWLILFWRTRPYGQPVNSNTHTCILLPTDGYSFNSHINIIKHFKVIFGKQHIYKYSVYHRSVSKLTDL
jgi:hypothetical protein